MVVFAVRNQQSACTKYDVSDHLMQHLRKFRQKTWIVQTFLQRFRLFIAVLSIQYGLLLNGFTVNR